MARRYGRCKRGERLVDHVPHGHWKITTFIAALRVDSLTAPLVIEGPIDGQGFTAYVEQILGPTLEHGDIVVMAGTGPRGPSATVMPARRLAHGQNKGLPIFAYLKCV